jgi:hypothetical protein
MQRSQRLSKARSIWRHPRTPIATRQHVPDAVLGGTESGRVVGQGEGTSGWHATSRPGEKMHRAQPGSLHSQAVKSSLSPWSHLSANRRVPPSILPSDRLCATSCCPFIRIRTARATSSAQRESQGHPAVRGDGSKGSLGWYCTVLLTLNGGGRGDEGRTPAAHLPMR